MTSVIINLASRAFLTLTFRPEFTMDELTNRCIDLEHLNVFCRECGISLPSGGATTQNCYVNTTVHPEVSVDLALVAAFGTQNMQLPPHTAFSGY